MDRDRLDTIVTLAVYDWATCKFTNAADVDPRTPLCEYGIVHTTRLSCLQKALSDRLHFRLPKGIVNHDATVNSIVDSLFPLVAHHND